MFEENVVPNKIVVRYVVLNNISPMIVGGVIL